MKTLCALLARRSLLINLAALDCHSEHSEESRPCMGGDASLRSA
jgi:hypothetical protein